MFVFMVLHLNYLPLEKESFEQIKLNNFCCFLHARFTEALDISRSDFNLDRWCFWRDARFRVNKKSEIKLFTLFRDN